MSQPIALKPEINQGYYFISFFFILYNACTCMCTIWTWISNLCFQLNETLVNDILEDVGVCRVPNLNGTAINPSTNLTLLQAQFRDVICDQDQVSQIFNFTSDAARDLVSDQLCNLTNPESINNVVLLLAALQRDFNSTSLIDQVWNYLKCSS